MVWIPATVDQAIDLLDAAAESICCKVCVVEAAVRSRVGPNDELSPQFCCDRRLDKCTVVPGCVRDKSSRPIHVRAQ